jgi:hypothetical protein
MSLPGWRHCAAYGCSLSVALSGCAAHVVPPTTAPRLGAGDAVATVILIGDAGAPKASGEPVLEAVRRSLAVRADSAVILFLGDNVYPRGIPDSADRTFPEASRRLRAQLELAQYVPVVFVPGNHDWQKSGPEGLASIRRQGRLIGSDSSGRARMLPAAGCPGPDILDVTDGLRLVLLDTEWWLFPHHRPADASACATRDRTEIIAGLARILEASSGRQVIVAGHHPLLTGGPHGGYFSASDHLFPLRAIHPALFVPFPIIGTIYPAVRSMGFSAEDMSGGPYRTLRAGLDSAFACRPPAIYAAGHEHTLQLLDRGRPPLLAVSGVGIAGHQSYVEQIPETRLALAQGGFMRADLLRDGRLRLAVVTVDGAGEPREVYAEALAPAGEWTGGCAPR